MTNQPERPRTSPVTIVLWALLGLFTAGAVALQFWPRAAERQPIHATETGQIEGVVTNLPADYVMPPFSLVDQDGKPFASAEMGNNVWIADFIFTRCQGPCPLMTRQMKQLQDRIADPRVKLLSFSADPRYDRPPVLKAYAKEHGAAEGRWIFATGSWDDMIGVAKGMRLQLMEEGSGLITHGTKLVLVGPDGRIHGYYSIDSAAAMDRLAADAVALARSLPSAP